MLLVPSGAMAAKAPTPKKQAKRAFALLLLDTKGTPKRIVSKRNKAKLVKIAKKARKASKRKPCKALKLMGKYNRGLRKVRERRVPGDVPGLGSFRGQLRSDMLRVNVALLQSPKSKKCGGGKPSKVNATDARVVSQDATQVRMKLLLPPPKFISQQAGGQDYQQMLMEGMGESGDIGQPGLPQLGKFYGVPVGADVSIEVNGSQGYDLPGVNLFPAQEPAVDKPVAPVPGAPDEGLFENPPFSKNTDTYRSGKPFPAEPASGDALGMMRDLRIGDVDVVGGRYTPKKRKLHVFTSLDVTVKFGGASTGKFGDTEDFNDPWNVFFNRNYSRLIVNDTAVSANLGDIKVNPQAFCGEEMLVITSPALEPAADTFANARRAAGINTRVALTGAGAGAAGTTNTEIQAFIRNHLTTEQCKLHPSYVVLIGNTAHVPSFLVECSPGAGFFPNPDKPDDYCDIGSDLPYSLNGVGTDLFADVELGRIPAPDLATANTVVNKIINYENSDPAPAGDDFYHHATVTGFFQQRVHCVLNEGSVGPQNCNENIGGVNGHYEPDYPNHTDERGFTKTSDSIIRAIQFNGYSVDRLWTTDPQSTPEFYYDGTPIPDNLRRPAFAWDSDTTDFLNAYNGGRFLILHRDHGWPNGWADPTLSSGDVPSMTNGTKLPVVMGINCASALFDNPADPSFVEEQIEKADGGAVAGFGDTRVSPTWPNNWMALGFTDAFFPNTVPDFGSDEPTRKLGDVLLSGKNYMAEGNSGGGEYVEHYLYHLLGDPSMQMWAAAPYHFDPGKLQVNFEAVPKPGPGDPPYHVFVQMPLGAGELPPAGTVATLRSAGAPIGRAIVGADGKATITPEVNSSRRLEVSFEQQGALPVADTVDGAP